MGAGQQDLKAFGCDDGKTAGDHRAPRQLEHQFVAAQQRTGATVAGNFQELLVIPVEAVGKLADRMFDHVNQRAAGAVAGGNFELAFVGLLELGIGQYPCLLYTSRCV